jgi:hypothetical protein
MPSLLDTGWQDTSRLKIMPAYARDERTLPNFDLGHGGERQTIRSRSTRRKKALGSAEVSRGPADRRRTAPHLKHERRCMAQVPSFRRTD